MAPTSRTRLKAIQYCLVEDMLESNGGIFQPHVVTDGNLVTGQNPPSSAGAASAVIRLLG
jgi:putative intracellular protease/amidase